MTNFFRTGFWSAVLALLLSCSDHGSVATAGLHRGLSGEPSTLDPMAAADNFSFEVLDDLYEGLTIEASDGDVLPGVAKSWSVDSTGTLYTFYLRENARWSNGKPVVSQDFVNAWRRVVDPKHGSPVADDLRPIAGASEIISGRSPVTALGAYAQGDSVLIVKLTEPVAYLPQLLTHSAAFPVYSEQNVNSRSPNTWVSNGAYVLSSWSPGTKLELVRNSEYWDRANVPIASIEYQIADENSQFARYRAGQLDVTDSVPLNAISKIRATYDNELHVAPFLATAYYALNLSKPPFANNKDLRQAVAMAIDRKRLVASLGFGQTGAYGFVPHGTWNYTSQEWDWSKLDDDTRIAKAKQLYSRAGYGSDKPLKLQLLFNSDPIIKNTAIIIAQMWKQTLGIDTILTDEEYRVFLQSRRDRKKWDAIRLGWTADFNDASNFLDVFREHSPNNDSGYADASFDSLLSDASRTANLDERRRMLEEDERKVLSAYPIVPLYFFVSKRLVKPYIRGFKTSPFNRVKSKTLSLSPHT